MALVEISPKTGLEAEVNVRLQLVEQASDSLSRETWSRPDRRWVVRCRLARSHEKLQLDTHDTLAVGPIANGASCGDAAETTVPPASPRCRGCRCEGGWTTQVTLKHPRLLRPAQVVRDVSGHFVHQRRRGLPERRISRVGAPPPFAPGHLRQLSSATKRTPKCGSSSSF